MNNIPWGEALAVFLGTLPLFGLIAWALIDTRSQFTEIRGQFAEVRKELTEIRKEISEIKERVAALEERDRWTHPIIK